MTRSFLTACAAALAMVMQNLVLAAQNDVPARELGAATSAVSFFRSMGGTIGVSVLGAILANKVTETLNPGGSSSGGGAVPNIAELPEQARAVVENAYGAATADLFMMSVPFAVLALVAVLFIKEKPLLTTSGAERRAAEEPDMLDA